MAWMETNYSKDTHFLWKIRWWLEHLGALRIMGEADLACWLFFHQKKTCKQSFMLKHGDEV